jgi:sugar transferase (PEP-CTERM/EpsH1 system associated)
MFTDGLRILFVTPYVPGSPRLRPNGFLRELSKKHRVTSVCFVYPPWEERYLQEVESYCEAVYPVIPNRWFAYASGLAALPSPLPASVGFCSSRKIKSIIRDLIATEKFDLLHTEFLRAAPYTADITGIPKVFDAVDSLALAYDRARSNPHGSLINRAFTTTEWLKMRSYEPRMLQHFDHVLVSSPVDGSHLESSPGPQVEVLPNGVDLDYFSYQGNGRNKAENSDRLVFLGKMSYYVNVDSMLYFSQHILPLIQAHRPDVRISIVGWQPTSAIQSLAANPAIKVTGGVPDVRPYLANATVCVCPMISGSGIQNKVLQAMAIGTPVVTTSLACQAMQVNHEEHLLVADNPETFALQVVRLLADPELRRKLSQNARSYVERNHDWVEIGKQLENMYYRILEA